jgi:NAD(P)-dependent dehydrogenase (short-subunit alcohol dehydrogenase family)
MDIKKIWHADLYAGKTVFVTGGSSGINLGIARTFAQLGARIAICGRTQEKLDRATGLLELDGARSIGIVADVREESALTSAFALTAEKLGPIDVLVCGAAGNFLSPAEKMSPNAFRTVVDIDLMGTFNAVRLAFEQLKQTRGCAVFVSANQAFVPYAFQAHAGAAKAGVEQLMRNLALEWGKYGIRINTVVPGPTDGTEGLMRLAPPALLKTLIDMVPLKRLGTLEEVGNMVAFLASPLAAYVTGAQFVCDGGQNLAGSSLMNMGVERLLSNEKN